MQSTMLESDDELALSVLKKEEDEKEQEDADYEDDGLYSFVNSHIRRHDSNNHVCSAQSLDNGSPWKIAIIVVSYSC